MTKPITKAIKLARGQSKLAKFFGISPQAVQQWEESGMPPAKRCVAIEEFLGGKVTRYQLRPDVFGLDPNAKTKTTASK